MQPKPPIAASPASPATCPAFSRPPAPSSPTTGRTSPNIPPIGPNPFASMASASLNLPRERPQKQNRNTPVINAATSLTSLLKAPLPGHAYGPLQPLSVRPAISLDPPPTSGYPPILHAVLAPEHFGRRCFAVDRTFACFRPHPRIWEYRGEIQIFPA